MLNMESRDLDQNPWTAALREHSEHESFRTEDNPYELCLGFSCSCCGEEETWEIPLRRFKGLGRAVQSYYAAVKAREYALETPQGAERLRRAGELEELRRLAGFRAVELLERHLDPGQLESFRVNKCFEVAGADGRAYRIEAATSNNVVMTDEGGDAVRLCAVFRERAIPVEDLMLAQKLMLESDPEAFRRIARAWDLRRTAA